MLPRNYNDILDKSFRKHFPLWDKLSPLDPLKTFAGSLSCAFAEIELRHDRTLKSLLHSLPSLFGFTLKAGRPAVGMFVIEPSSTLAEVRCLTPDTLLRFGSEKSDWYLQASNPTEIFPATLIDQKPSGNNLVDIKLETRGIGSHLVLDFIPEPDTLGAVVNFVEVIGHGVRGEITHQFLRSDLRWAETTSRFLTTGKLSIFPAGGTELWNRATRELTVRLHFQTPPRGSFRINLMAAGIWQKEPSLELGLLQGEPWEELKLPETLLTVPSTVSLLFPDGIFKKVSRLEGDLLSLHEKRPEVFEAGYFYHAGNHSLLFPSARIAAGSYRGIVRVMAPEALTSPLNDCFSPAEDKLILKDNPLHAVIANVTPLHKVAPGESREKTGPYLERFYSSLRQFSARAQGENSLHLEEIRAQILNQIPESRRVELALEKNTLTVFIDLSENESAPNQLPAEILARIAQLLNRTVPLAVQWAIAPFKNISLRLPSAGIFDSPRTEDKNILNREMAKLIRQRLAGNRLPLGESIPSTELLAALQNLIPQRDFPVALTQLAFERTDSGVITDSLTRAPGEFFEIHLIPHWEQTPEVRHA